MIVETIVATGFTYEIADESVLVPGRQVNHRIGYRCPACNRDLGDIEHGICVTCPCGLWITPFGNSIEMRKDET